MKTLRAVLLGIVLLTGLPAAFAGDCKKVSEVCVEGPSTKNIMGKNIFKSCWKYQADFHCQTQAPIDHCAAINNTPGCNVVNSTCIKYTSPSVCATYQKTYRCGRAITPPAGTIRIADSHTIIHDEIDTRQCASYKNNPSCKETGSVCTEGAGTRIIDGMPIYKDCWKGKLTYSCIVENRKDFCMPLKQHGCRRTSEKCVNTGFSGECIEKEFQYRCGEKETPLPTRVKLLDTSYTIVKDSLDMSQCLALEKNPNCTVASQTCIQGAGTRNINGLDVYKDCWEWQKEYTCTSANLESTCNDLKNNPLCKEVDAQCVDVLPDGQCGLLEHQYKCSESTPTTSTHTDCGTQTFCIDGTCFDSGYEPDTDFASAIAMMEIARQGANYSIFKGEAKKCSVKLIKNCCKTQGGGQKGRNDFVAKELGVAAMKFGSEYAYVAGSQYVYDALGSSMSDGVFSVLLGSGDGGGLLSGFSSFHVWGFKFGMTAEGVKFINFNPYMFAAQLALTVVMEMMQCDEEEQMLGIRRGQGLCHQVGSYCSHKVLKVCLEVKQGWCCFPSKLGRIINEQGRQQLGRGWGSPKNPQCDGFKPDDLEKLDFSKMDLSEFLADIVPNVKDASFAKQRLEEKARSYYGK